MQSKLMLSNANTNKCTANVLSVEIADVYHNPKPNSFLFYRNLFVIDQKYFYAIFMLVQQLNLLKNNYCIGGYRTPVFYLFLPIFGCSQWTFFVIFSPKQD